MLYDVLFVFLLFSVVLCLHVEPTCSRSPLKKRSMISMGFIWLNKGLKFNFGTQFLPYIFAEMRIAVILFTIKALISSHIFNQSI